MINKTSMHAQNNQMAALKTIQGQDQQGYAYDME